MNWLEISYERYPGLMENYFVSHHEIKYIKSQGLFVVIYFLDSKITGYLKKENPDFFDDITSAISHGNYFSFDLYWPSGSENDHN